MSPLCFIPATRYSNQLKSRFSIQVSQIELLGSMTIGMLNEMCAKAGAQDTSDDFGAATDDGSAKYGEPLIPILNDRLAYDEPYTTDASPHQYRIWLAQVCIWGLFIYNFMPMISSANTTTLASAPSARSMPTCRAMEPPSGIRMKATL